MANNGLEFYHGPMILFGSEPNISDLGHQLFCYTHRGTESNPYINESK